MGKKSMTSTVYIINDNRLLLHIHKKYNSLFPVGGHIEEGELPQEAAIREVKEECGLDIELYNSQNNIGMTRVRQLINPQYTLLENIGQEVENIDFIYFARTNKNVCVPQDGESRKFCWLTREEITNSKDIKEHIRLMALEAFNTLSE